MESENQSFEEALKAYEQDPRVACKYRSKCYQTNPAHLQKYKHAPKRFATGGERYPNKRPKNDGPDGKKSRAAEYSGEPFNNQASDIEELDEVIDFEVKTGRVDQDDSDTNSHDDSNKTHNVHTTHNASHKKREFIKTAFLVEMPRDFYDFWSFCEHLSSEKPSEALSQVGLTLVGPFDVVSGKLGPKSEYKKSEYLRHWRYYYDPPEFQTVIKADDKTLLHIGYFRDDPKELPCFVANNSAAVDSIIKPMAENLFGAVNTYLDDYQSKANPFQKMKVPKLQAKLQEWAASHKITLELNTPAMKSRSKKTVCKTFHRAGMVVPYDKKTELGYRSLIQSESNLKKMMQKVVSATTPEERDAHLGKLQEIITAANIATDECDFGTGLELALDLFSFGSEIFHNIIKQLAATAYGLLGREEFSTILEAHLEDRKKGNDLSILKKKEMK